MIIGRFSFGFETGNNEWFSMLLNSWDIYERFLRKIFEIYLKATLGSDLLIEKKNIGNRKSWDKDKIIPDIIIQKYNDILLLCDAKYKLEYNRDDKYQGAYYIREFLKKYEKSEVDFNIKNRNLLLIYPSNKLSNYKFNPIEKNPVPKYGTIFAHSIDLSQIDDKSYIKSWIEQIIKRFLK